MRRIPLPHVLVLALALVLASVTLVGAESGGGSRSRRSYEVALTGDLPYNEAQEAGFARVADEINGERDVAFTIFDGDFKNGSGECTDEVYSEALARFEAFRQPLVYTPGDNEWTDCHRILATDPASPNGDPLERLGYLRTALYPDPAASLGRRTLALESQAAAGYPENARWSKGPVTYATLHVVGSNDNLPVAPETSPGDPAEHAARSSATIEWMRSAFHEAIGRGDKGIVLSMQADPNFEVEPGDPSRSGFEDFLVALRDEVVAFDGQVVLVHGDSHYFREDKPLRTDDGGAIGNFTRLETFGNPDVHWVRMTVDPRDPELFSFDQEIIEANLELG